MSQPSHHGRPLHRLSTNGPNSACGWGPRFVAPRETLSQLQLSGGGEAPTPATPPDDK